jgi:hypothetical protein
MFGSRKKLEATLREMLENAARYEVPAIPCTRSGCRAIIWQTRNKDTG